MTVPQNIADRAGGRSSRVRAHLLGIAQGRRLRARVHRITAHIAARPGCPSCEAQAHQNFNYGVGLLVGTHVSIVRAIAAAREASVTAHPIPDGGLSVSVIFPNPEGATCASSTREA